MQPHGPDCLHCHIRILIRAKALKGELATPRQRREVLLRLCDAVAEYCLEADPGRHIDARNHAVEYIDAAITNFADFREAQKKAAAKKPRKGRKSEKRAVVN